MLQGGCQGRGRLVSASTRVIASLDCIILLPLKLKRSEERRVGKECRL